MVFMIVVATKMLSATSSLKSTFGAAAVGQSSQDSSIIAAMAFFCIPIVILWMGLGIAQSMSVAGASAVVGRGQKFMKWAGKGALNAPGKAAWWGTKKTGAPGATKQRWDQYKKEGLLGSERTAQREAKLAAIMGVKGAEEKDMQRRAEEYKKQHMGPDELKELAIKGDAAAAYRLFEDNYMDDETYGKFMKASKSEKLRESVSKKAKQNRADFAINYKAEKEADKKLKEELAKNPTLTLAQQNAIKTTERHRVYEEDIDKLSTEQWSKQNWGDIINKSPHYIPYIISAFNNLPIEAKEKISENLSKHNAEALRDVGIAIPRTKKEKDNL
jgi:hypothetical protein